MKAENGAGDERWKNYNYPPCIRLIHYSLVDLQEPMYSLARKLHASAIIVALIHPI